MWPRLLPLTSTPHPAVFLPPCRAEDVLNLEASLPRRMKGFHWRYSRLVKDTAWAGGRSGKVGDGELSGRVGPGLELSAGG